MFFKYLSGTIGHELEFVMADQGPQTVKHYDQYYYDNIILMAPSIKGKFIYNRLILVFRE